MSEATKEIPVLAGSTGLSDGERTQFWREPGYDNLECLHARFLNHTFTPHVHETYVFGVIEQGLEVFNIRGETSYGTPGTVLVLNPDVLHDGVPGEDGYVYRMIYPSTRLMQDLAADVIGPGSDLPFFTNAGFDDPQMASEFVALHENLKRGTDRLSSEEAMVGLVSNLVLRQADHTATLRPIGREGGLVRKVVERLEEDLVADVTLNELADQASVSRFHLLRAFKRELGVTPNTFRLCRRVGRARQLLAGAGKGSRSLAEVAVECGFADQAHFTRAFKSVVGVPPGQYRDSLAA